jgi:hypothetical protein
MGFFLRPLRYGSPLTESRWFRRIVQTVVRQPGLTARELTISKHIRTSADLSRLCGCKRTDRMGSKDKKPFQWSDAKSSSGKSANAGAIKSAAVWRAQVAFSLSADAAISRSTRSMRNRSGRERRPIASPIHSLALRRPVSTNLNIDIVIGSTMPVGHQKWLRESHAASDQR